jgi:predicted nucleic acid-binding protein
VIHEVYRLTLEREGRETAILRTKLLEKGFKVISVDAYIAKNAAELRHKYRIPVTDSLIAATAISLNAICISDDSHFKIIKELKTKWI